MTIFEALVILESAVSECKKRNVNTPEATTALDLLAPYVRPKLVVAHFRHHIAGEHEKEDQQEALRATFPEIRNSIRELIRQELDALARDFPDTDDIELKNAIACLAKEYGKLGEPWVFVERPGSRPTSVQ
jgi:hypothetical protein